METLKTTIKTSMLIYNATFHNYLHCQYPGQTTISCENHNCHWDSLILHFGEASKGNDINTNQIKYPYKQKQLDHQAHIHFNHHISHGPSSFESWLLREELLVSVNSHVITKNKLGVGLSIPICLAHQLWCRSHGGHG